MSIVAHSLAEMLLQSSSDSMLYSTAREVLFHTLVPRRFDSSTIERMFRKALRLGVWRRLQPEARALILTLRSLRRVVVRSRVLVEVLRRLYIEIELSTFKGRALLYGAALAIKRGLISLTKLVEISKELIQTLLYLGISYINSPLIYRVYG